MKTLFINVLITLTFIVFILAIRMLIFDVLRISSDSMEPTLKSGDYILVSKISYGPRIISFRELIFSKKLSYIWLNGFSQVKKDDVIIFNLPQYNLLTISNDFIYGTVNVKRVFGIPGDSINYSLTRSHILANKLDLTSNFNNDLYESISIPKKGDTIELKLTDNIYFNNILRFESFQKSNSIEQSTNKCYKFKHNYYFLLGDNFLMSNDSRSWGLLPETHIIGKAVLVLFSVDQSKIWLNKIRFRRIFKRVQ